MTLQPMTHWNISVKTPGLGGFRIKLFAAVRVSIGGPEFTVLQPLEGGATPVELTVACEGYSELPENPHVSPGRSWCWWARAKSQGAVRNAPDKAMTKWLAELQERAMAQWPTQ